MRNEVWAVIAGGNSVTADDVEALRGRVRVLCINDAWKWAPWGDAVYAADYLWWQEHHEAVREHFEGRMFTCTNSADSARPYGAYKNFGCYCFEQEPDSNIRHSGLSDNPTTLRIGGLSGYQGIGVVKNWGAKVAITLGYDMCRTNGKIHPHGDHKKPLRPGPDFKAASNFNAMKPEEHGLTVINCSPNTVLTCWPRMTVQDALRKYA